MIRKILIYNSGGGLGDSILLIPLILSLQNKFDNSEIYYLGAHENHFSNKLKEYNIKIKNLEMNLKYFGFRWWHLLKVKENFRKVKEIAGKARESRRKRRKLYEIKDTRAKEK